MKFDEKVEQKVNELLDIKDINDVHQSIIEKNIKRFKVDEFVIPKIGDNLIDILDTMEFIRISERIKNIKLIENIENLINKYMELYNGKNLNNLYLIKRKLVHWQENGWINKKDENFFVNYNGIKTKKIEMLYHETGINLIKFTNGVQDVLDNCYGASSANSIPTDATSIRSYKVNLLRTLRY